MSILISKRSALSLLLANLLMYGASAAESATVPIIKAGHAVPYSFNSSISNFGAVSHGNMVFIALRFIALKLFEPVSFNSDWKTIQVRGVSLKIGSRVVYYDAPTLGGVSTAAKVMVNAVPFIQNRRVCIPIEFVKLLGHSVNREGGNVSIILSGDLRGALPFIGPHPN